ncbi:MAG TPA: hypothetical protein DEF16_10770 [Gemmobacter sp.]|nr:hypothetical protein [Gemmobacter sp.]
MIRSVSLLRGLVAALCLAVSVPVWAQTDPAQTPPAAETTAPTAAPAPAAPQPALTKSKTAGTSTGSKSISSGVDTGDIDYAAWEQMAGRAETVLAG